MISSRLSLSLPTQDPHKMQSIAKLLKKKRNALQIDACPITWQPKFLVTYISQYHTERKSMNFIRTGSYSRHSLSLIWRQPTVQFLPARMMHDSGKEPTTRAEPETHFGFTNVPESKKEELVGQVFAKVAAKYDIMNDAMSGGIHRLWKDYFIKTMAPGPNTKLLDVAGGTGDIAMRFLEYCRKVHGDETAQVVCADINPRMLEVGRERFEKTPFMNSNQISFQVQNAERLDDISDNSFDCYTIAFGIRNVTHIDRVLSEAFRILKPGGRFMCLEFSKVENPIIEKLYDFYSFDVIPVLGQIIAQDRDSYQYLVESIRKFPEQTVFADMIRKAGFTTVDKGYENLTFGVAAIHSGFKL